MRAITTVALMLLAAIAGILGAAMVATNEDVAEPHVIVELPPPPPPPATRPATEASTGTEQRTSAAPALEQPTVQAAEPTPPRAPANAAPPRTQAAGKQTGQGSDANPTPPNQSVAQRAPPGTGSGVVSGAAVPGVTVAPPAGGPSGVAGANGTATTGSAPGSAISPASPSRAAQPNQIQRSGG